MDNASTETVEHNDNNVPVTDSANPIDNNSVAKDTKSDKSTTPRVESRDGKLFVDGVRVYTRDDTNKIAANAKHEAERTFLSELNVDSLDSVKKVVSTLQEVSPESGASLNVESLRDAVKRREATVEELKAQVQSLKTDLLLKDHMGRLQSAMPTTWSQTQRDSVIKLMKADNMLAVQGDTFAIRNGENYLTVDGETPDYTAAVEIVGKSLGLPFGKKGVDIQYGETSGSKETGSIKPVDNNRLNSDVDYRSAYMQLRKYKPNVSRNDITDNMVRKQLDAMGKK